MTLDPIVSTADLANYLQQNLDDYGTEALYATELASAAVRAYCRRSLTYLVDDERVLRWRPELVLPDPPIVQITSVTVADTAVDWVRLANGTIAVNGTSEDDVTITYTHGFAELPAIIPMVAVRIAARVFKNPLQRVSYGADNVSYTTAADVAPRILTGDEQMMLKPYRLNRVLT
jgi:hypothetical protein